ncbi:glycosyltransferase family 4 protein [Halocola ammonii]
MKIALFTDGISPLVMGGIQRHSYYLCKYLARNGIEIDLYHTVPYFAQSYEEGVEKDYSNLSSVFSKDELRSITSFFIPFPKHKKLPGHYVRESYEYSCRVYEAFLKHSDNVDFVYSKNYTSWKYLEEKQKGKSIPPIGVMLHGYEIFQTQTNATDFLGTFFHKEPTIFNSRMADIVFSYGGKISEILKKKTGVLPEQIYEIPTGISEDWLLQDEKKTRHNGKTNFVFLGRYTRRKGIHLIEQVIRECDPESCTFTFVGPIPESRQLKLPNVEYTGPLHDEFDIRKELQKADVLLCPSSAEGMPNVILEGMASGCAIIATDVGAVSEMVSDEVGALLENHGYELFSRAVEKIIELNSAELSQLQNNSLRKVKSHFTWDEVVQKKLTSISGFLTDHKSQ